MIIGSGLLARAFAERYSQRDDVCIYAAGVSNSSCTDISEFMRERKRLVDALQTFSDINVFVYFGTCSATDAELQNTQYVQHKLAMEHLVAQHPRHIIFRLPQLAGHTPNPHTLLNYLYARIARSEAFSVWSNAYRNIIDVEDATALAAILIDSETKRQCKINLANPDSYSVLDIITTMEQVVGKRAIYDTVSRGNHYAIDVTTILPIINQAKISFDKNYLLRVINKYYSPQGY